VLDLIVKSDCADSDEEKEIQPWLNDTEFLQKCRMSRKNFDQILDRIEDCSVFKKLEGKSGHPQAVVAHQLMVFLKAIVTEGTGADGPNQRNTFMIGKGSSNNPYGRVTEALFSLLGNFTLGLMPKSVLNLLALLLKIMVCPMLLALLAARCFL